LAAPAPNLAKTLNAFDAVMRDAQAQKMTYADAVRGTGTGASPASSSNEPAHAQPPIFLSARSAEHVSDAPTANWRHKRKMKDAELRPRVIANNEDDPTLTPAQRTMARLRRRAAEREAQAHTS
jgi:hypothetical protein